MLYLVCFFKFVDWDKRVDLFLQINNLFTSLHILLLEILFDDLCKFFKIGLMLFFKFVHTCDSSLFIIFHKAIPLSTKLIELQFLCFFQLSSILLLDDLNQTLNSCNFRRSQIWNLLASFFCFLKHWPFYTILLMFV